MTNEMLKETLEKQIQHVAEQSRNCRIVELCALSETLYKLVVTYWVLTKHSR